jgi:hypothetical protein
VKRLVVLESPYAGDVDMNIAYARACLRDSLLRGEAPSASHLLYTQPGVLRDNDPDERRLGIDAGLAFGRAADASVVYVDLGVSAGMAHGIERAHDERRPVEKRRLDRLPRRPPITDPISAAVETLKAAGIEPATRAALDRWNESRLAQFAEDFRKAAGQ